MAVNERIQRDQNDLYFGQLAPSQANREDYYPGKPPSQVRAGDANWEKDFRVPIGDRAREVPGGPVEVERVRVLKLHRGSISDQTIAAPVVTGMKTITITSPEEWGATTPQHTVTETETQDVDGQQERTAGYDWAEGLV